jgi:hypothetical protein
VLRFNPMYDVKAGFIHGLTLEADGSRRTAVIAEVEDQRVRLLEVHARQHGVISDCLHHQTCCICVTGQIVILFPKSLTISEMRILCMAAK